MPYNIPTFEAIRVDYLRDVKNLDSQAHVDSDSDNYIRGSAVSSAAHGLYHHQNYLKRQILPSTSDPDFLEIHASNRGMTLKEANKADGTVTLARMADDVPAFGPGLVAVYTYTDQNTGEEAALSITITEGWQGGAVPDGGITLTAEAAQAGAFPQLEDAIVTLQSAPEGVATEAKATLYGGTDAETYPELLARLLFRMRNPPGGGTASDYVLWAMEVPGVTWAKCYPLRRGAGTVDVVIATRSGTPGPQLVTKTQEYVDKKRPVTCPDCKVFAPVAATVDIIAKTRLASGSGYTLPSITLVAGKELAARHFNALYPGDPFYVRRAQAALIGVTGIEDAEITAPIGNLPAHALTWYRQGTLALEAM